jgi:hypothetical protein
MKLTYSYTIGAPATATVKELTAFLKGVEREAKTMGFRPTVILNVVLETAEQKHFARHLTAGFPVEDARLKGAEFPKDGRVWRHDGASGACHVPPLRGIVLVVTNEHGAEVRFGFFQYPETIEDMAGRVVAETGLAGAWSFQDFVKSPDPRYRRIVKLFAEAGYVEDERDEFAGS